MNSPPKLSILALCYNHEAFLDEALISIKNLQYSSLEVWILDDASQDQSPAILRKWKENQPDWNFIFHEKNQGNCQSFNEILKLATGEYVLDFATDDILVSDQIADWIGKLETNPEVGFCYADAWIFKTSPVESSRFSKGHQIRNYPEGNILKALFAPSFICPPAVLFRKTALDSVGGYDENLAYEDWDIWLRLARIFPVCHYPEPVIYYRKHVNSMSASLFRNRNERHLNSTISILNRILEWEELKNCQSEIIPFVAYHVKISGFLQLPDQAKTFIQILEKLTEPGFMHRFYLWLSQSKLPVYPIFKVIAAIRNS